MEIHAFTAISFAIIGLLFGSFANVCVHRIPLGESIVSPRSRCPHCRTEIVWYDNIPILSWLLLGRQCRHCQAPIIWRYPILELTMGLAWGVMAWYFPVSLFLAQAIVLVSILWILTLIDLETFLLPDVITLPGIIIGLLFAWQMGYMIDAFIGVVAGYGIFWLVAKLFFLATGREGMGQGDFKLLAMLGAFMGWQAIPFIILLSSVTGIIIGSISLLLAKKGLQAEIPYGPYLAAAGTIWFFWNQKILDWYQAFMLV